MIKKIIALPLVLLLLTACNSNNPKEIVTLTTDNFATYVACNTIDVCVGNSGYIDYFTYFVGADYCKFINCTVTYGYAYQTNPVSGTPETVPLTLSGDGQANHFRGKYTTSGSYYRLVVIEANGTVEVYR